MSAGDVPAPRWPALANGTPVIVVNRTAFSADRLIRLTRYIYRGDRVRLAHEVGSSPEKYRVGWPAQPAAPVSQKGS
jgi:hypothetical protein